MAKLSDLERSINQRLSKLFDRLSLDGVVSSLEEFCEKGGLDYSNYQKYLRLDDTAKELKGKSIVKLTESFGVNTDWLFFGKEPMLKSDKKSSKQNRPNPELVEPHFVDMQGNSVIPIINLKAAANSAMGYNSQESFEILDYASLPPMLISPDRKNYWVQLDNDSMEIKFKKDDWVVCQKLERSEWGSIKDLDLFIVVSRTEGIQFKRIKNRLKEHGFIRCRSDNRKYASFNVKEADLLELWRYKLHISADGSNLNEDIFNKVDGLEDTVHDLQMLINGMGRQISEIQKRVIK